MRQLATVELAQAGEATLATLGGEVDMSNADALGERLATAVPNDARGLVIDMRPLSYVDSAGLRVLFALDERLRRRGQRLALVLGAGTNVERVLELTGLAGAVAVERDVEAAVARVGARAAG